MNDLLCVDFLLQYVGVLVTVICQLGTLFNLLQSLFQQPNLILPVSTTPQTSIIHSASNQQLEWDMNSFCLLRTS